MAKIKKAQSGTNLPEALKAKGTPSIKNSGYKPSTSEEISKVKKYTPPSENSIKNSGYKPSTKEEISKIKKWSPPKKKNGGSLSGLKASTKRVGPVDPKGAFTKVQEKTLAGAKGKAKLVKDKQLGATKMTAKSGKKISKK
jgi:hypothetical protein